MRILIVKLSSLGDVVHALPVVADIRAAHAGATIDWVSEPAFAPVLRQVRGIAEVIECPLRSWLRRGWWTSAVRTEMRSFLRRLRRDRYDAIVDLQGLTKSAVIARLARGPSFGLANRTDGASHEWPARWLVTTPIRVEPRSHALDRSRALVAKALGSDDTPPPRFGLGAGAAATASAASPDAALASTVVLVHGTSRTDKLWPETSWVELGRRLANQGARVALPQSSEAERQRAHRIAGAIGDAAEVWPAMPLGDLVERLARTAGVVGVDSGPSHIAVALDLPHVQIYNVATAWRTGPQVRHGHRHQVSIEGRPTPSVDAVWAAWQRVTTPAS